MSEENELLEKAKSAETFEEQMEYVGQFLDLKTSKVARLLESKMDKVKTEENFEEIKNNYEIIVPKHLRNKNYETYSTR